MGKMTASKKWYKIRKMIRRDIDIKDNLSFLSNFNVLGTRFYSLEQFRLLLTGEFDYGGEVCR